MAFQKGLQNREQDRYLQKGLSPCIQLLFNASFFILGDPGRKVDIYVPLLIVLQ